MFLDTSNNYIHLIGLKKSPCGDQQNLCCIGAYGDVKCLSNSSSDMASFNSLYIMRLANFLAQFGKVAQQNFRKKTSKTAFHQMNLSAMLLGNQVLKK